MISASQIINSLKKAYVGSNNNVTNGSSDTSRCVAWVSHTQGVVLYSISNALKAKVFTVSSTGSITFGSEYSVDASSNFARCVYCPAQDKVLVVYGDNDASPGMFSRVLTVSGTSISVGSEKIIYSSTSYTLKWELCYDPVLEAVHILYTIDLSGYKTYIRYLYGSTLASISTARLITTSALSNPGITYDTASSRVVITYDSSSTQYGRVASVSGSTYTWGTATSVNTSVTNAKGICYDSQNNKVIFLARKSNLMSFTPCTVSGTSLSVGTTTSNTTVTAYYMGMAMDNSSSRIFCLGGTGVGSCYYFLANYRSNGSIYFTPRVLLDNTGYPKNIEIASGFRRVAHFNNIYGVVPKLKMIQIS